MLTIWGRANRYCDGIARREFLRVGALGAGALGLTLADVLRLQAEPAGDAGLRGKKSVIMVFLPGGPPHLDMYDLKPEAPAEFRGEMFLLRGQVVEAVRDEPLPEAGQRFEMEHYYRCKLLLAESGQEAVVYARTVPPAWKLGEPIQDRASASSSRTTTNGIMISTTGVPPAAARASAASSSALTWVRYSPSWSTASRTPRTPSIGFCSRQLRAASRRAAPSSVSSTPW